MLEPEFAQWATDLLAHSRGGESLENLLGDSLPLSRVLEILQGTASEQADCGIARLSALELDALSSSAAYQSDRCLDRIRLVFELLDACTASGALPPQRTTLTLLCRQVLALLEEYRRWVLLADNAGYYRDHPEVARRVAWEWESRCKPQDIFGTATRAVP